MKESKEIQQHRNLSQSLCRFWGACRNMQKHYQQQAPSLKGFFPGLLWNHTADVWSAIFLRGKTNITKLDFYYFFTQKNIINWMNN